MNNRIYVLFHRKCSDGAGARFAAWLKFGKDATYVDVQYHEPLPEIPDGSDVYILDFSYDRQTLVDLHARMNKLVVLDHHESAKNELQGLDFATFDMDECGAVMAWKYFHGDKPMPDMFETVRDYDLYRFQKPWTREISAAWVNYRDKNEAWNEVCLPGNSFTSMLISAGRVIVEEHRVLLDEMMKQARLIELFGSRVAVLCTSVLADQANERMQKDPVLKPDFTITYYVRSDGKVKLSLRSGGAVEVNKVAQHYGGGGNKQTAGAVISLEALEGLLQTQPLGLLGRRIKPH